MTLYASRAAAEVAADRLKTYAQPQRLMILSRLIDGEHTVGDIEEATGIRQPGLSQQLAELRRAAIVKTRKVSKQVFYRLADEKVLICVRGIEAMFGTESDVEAALGGVIAGFKRVTPTAHPKAAAAFARLGP